MPARREPIRDAPGSENLARRGTRIRPVGGAAGAQAGRWEIRQEVREGKRSIAREHLEARREIRHEINEQRRDADRRGYWRDGRYYRLRDGRYFRCDRDRDRWYDDEHDDDDRVEILKGALIGPAMVGVAAAIIESNDSD